jgi:hypothetical protein
MVNRVLEVACQASRPALVPRTVGVSTAPALLPEQLHELLLGTSHRQIELAFHQLDIEPQYAITKPAQHLIAPSIGSAPPLVIFAVHLNHEANFGSQQIKDKPPRDRDLSLELNAKPTAANGLK